MTKTSHPLFNRIAILIFLCLFLSTEGACAAGTLKHTFKESFSSQHVAPTPYPLLSECLADPSCTDFLIVGHRGTVKFAPENTFAAFDRAIELGVDVIELDVRKTADGYLVVMHDATVDRTTDGHGRIDEMTLEEIQELTIRSNYPNIPAQKVPTFREALAYLENRIPINVDVKTDLLEKVAAEVEQMDMLDQAYMLTKSLDDGYRFRTANPSIRLQARAYSADEVYRYLDELHPMAVQIDLSFLQPELVDAIHAAGAKVYIDASGSFDTLGRLGYALLHYRGVDVTETDRLPVAVRYARKMRR
jgi:glycerophosphoryl diester phosphodiesterase